MSPTSYQTAPPRGGPSTLAPRAPAANPAATTPRLPPWSVVRSGLVVVVVDGATAAARSGPCPVPDPAPASASIPELLVRPARCPRAGPRLPRQVAGLDRVVVRGVRIVDLSMISRSSAGRSARRARSAWSGLGRPARGLLTRLAARTPNTSVSASWSVSRDLHRQRALAARLEGDDHPLHLRDGVAGVGRDVQRPHVQQRLLDRYHEQVGRQSIGTARGTAVRSRSTPRCRTGHRLHHVGRTERQPARRHDERLDRPVVRRVALDRHEGRERARPRPRAERATNGRKSVKASSSSSGSRSCR